MRAGLNLGRADRGNIVRGSNKPPADWPQQQVRSWCSAFGRMAEEAEASALHRCPTYLVDFAERAVAQLADYFPDVVGINVPMNVLVLLDFLLDFQSGQTQDSAESSERHGSPVNNIQEFKKIYIFF